MSRSRVATRTICRMRFCRIARPRQAASPACRPRDRDPRARRHSPWPFLPFALRQYLARGNEADFQCLRLDDHARDMAFDQLAGTLDRWVKRSSQPPLRTDAELVRMRRAHAWRWARRRRACWQACADAGGNRMTPAHATKKAERYRYYVSAPLLADDRPLAQKGMRVPAGDMEGLVLDRLIIRALFSSRIGVSDRTPRS